MSVGIVMAAAVAVAGAPGAPPQAEAAVTAYPAAFFAASQPTTALDMVLRLPGFALDTGAGVRGFGGAAGNVLIDGTRPPAKGDPLDQILQRIPASSVLRIDLIRAGAPGIDMQGKTVLANVVRRTDISGKVTVTTSATRAYDGRFSGQLRLEGEKRIGKTDLQGSLLAGRFLDDGAGVGTWTRTFGAGGGVIKAADATQGHEINYKATGSVETPVLGGTLKLNASLLIDPYRFTERDLLTPPPGEDLDQFFKGADTAELGLRYERRLTSRASVEIYALQQLGRQKTLDVFTSDPFTAALTGDEVSADFALRRSTSESIVRTTVKYAAAKTLSVETGLEGDYNWLRSRTAFTQNGAPVALPAANVVVTELRGEAFATAVWQARPNLTVEAGLRGEGSRIASSGRVISARSLYFAKPRLVVAWSPDKADQLRLRVEREVGQLNFDDFTAQTAGINTGTVHAGNPELNPEQDWVIEAAWDRRFWGGGDATVTVRHYQLASVEDRVGVFDPSGIFDAPGNIGSGTKDEAAFTLTLPTDRLGLANGQLTGQATFRRSRVTDPTTGTPREISGLHGSDWELHFNQGLPRWKAAWGFDVLGQFGQTFYRFNEIDTDKFKTYVGLFAEYKPRTDLTLKVEILNASGRHFEHFRGVYLGPRDRDPVAFTDLRDQGVGRFVRVTLIKSFG